jgi:CO/xanthine dehydrogenase Mo-binding subunit
VSGTDVAGISVARSAMTHHQEGRAVSDTASALGRSIPRVDGGEKVAGLTRFAADVTVPGLLHARLVTSPHPHARVVSIDTGPARAVPGVVGVFTARDLPLAQPRGAGPRARGRARAGRRARR